MRVVCIDDKLTGPPQADFLIKECEQYEVLDTFEMGKQGWWWHELSIQPGVAYAVERFIPLSQIDETTFERNYKKELV